MTINYERLYNQTVTIWRAVPDGYGGYTFSSPVSTYGRWQFANELFRDQNGDEAVSEAIAYLPVDVSEGDWLCEGDFTMYSGPSNVPGARQIRRYLKSPDLKNVDYT